jgi:hypothetical protein
MIVLIVSIQSSDIRTVMGNALHMESFAPDIEPTGPNTIPMAISAIGSRITNRKVGI